MIKRGLLLFATINATNGFHHILPPIDVSHLQHFHPVSSLHHGDILKHAPHLLDTYKGLLLTHPLPTKMLTGATLAVAGDAIAQNRDRSTPYDTPRAVSFAAFDMCYRALQHALFPIIVAHCNGQYIGGAIDAVVPMLHGDTSMYAAMEQTLVSQLGIVPFMYYPVFYVLTAFVQGLTVDGAIQRAKETFLPLMKRNLIFWIPVQFIQFGFIEENLQIPFLSVCGLVWSFILSIMAGSTKGYTQGKSASEAEQIKAIEKAIYSGLNEKENSVNDIPVVAAAIEYYGASSLSGSNSTEVASVVYAYEKALARNK